MENFFVLLILFLMFFLSQYLLESNPREDIKDEKAAARKEISEGIEKKGGVNIRPSTPSPPPPKGQGVSKTTKSFGKK